MVPVLGCQNHKKIVNKIPSYCSIFLVTVKACNGDLTIYCFKFRQKFHMQNISRNLLDSYYFDSLKNANEGTFGHFQYVVRCGRLNRNQHSEITI